MASVNYMPTVIEVPTRGHSIRVHELKTVRPWFSVVYYGYKTAELRKHDRDYRVGDRLRLREWFPAEECYGSNEVLARITHIVTDADGPWLAPGYCMLSLKVLALKP